MPANLVRVSPWRSAKTPSLERRTSGRLSLPEVLHATSRCYRRPNARTLTTLFVTPTKLTIWALTSVGAAVIAIFVPTFGEDMRVLDGILPITAFLCAAAVSGIALDRISDRHAPRVAVGLAIGAFLGLVIGSNGPADAQAGLETFLTLPVGIVVGTFAGFLLRPSDPRGPAAASS